MCSNVGESLDTAIVIKYKFTGIPLGYPVGLTARFNGMDFIGVTSNRYGYLPKLFVGDDHHMSFPDLVSGSPWTLDGYAWQPFTNTFEQTSPINALNIALTDINTTTSRNPDECYMIIPKIAPSQTVDARVYSPHTGVYSQIGAGGCDITIPCPDALSLMSISPPSSVSAADVCGANLSKRTYIMRVNSAVGGGPLLYDRVFIDSTGQTPMLPGYYAINPDYPGNTAATAWMRVDSDGVVQATGSCADGTSVSLTEMTSSTMSGGAVQACEYQNLSGTNVPDQQYWHNGAGDGPAIGNNVYSDVTGTTALPDGSYQLLRGYTVITVVGGVVQSPILNCGTI